ncbi:hypothetical protein ABT390_04030 [Streptomyces aurantiacus]|uniref:Uncharacterized protein n=1 Tax=Streptomyces aurantiacus JA 4570 TaxID=1286094 RepID=S4AU95_9ACTN|nr:hypothetical protein [Streptomyces aurantiacus]EPH44992.1 hypothetical protein STRAU_1893 [Streptomyces aurantiacus JA 4570]
MTSPIDALLDGALLLDDTPTPHDPVPPQRAFTAPPAEADALDHTVARAADGDLRILCEAVVTAKPLTSVTDFLTEFLPTPSGALVLGCMLQLNNSGHTARFLWQYAAGAGETAAAYCLYLHHLTLGEANEAAWWKQQTPDAALPAPETEDPVPRREPRPACEEPLLKLEWPTDPPHVSVAATLRMLGILRMSSRARLRSWPPVVLAVMEYAAVAVRFVDDDVELPLPVGGFHDRVLHLTALPVHALDPAPCAVPDPDERDELPPRPSHRAPWPPGPWQHPTYRKRGRNNRAYIVEYKLKCGA